MLIRLLAIGSKMPAWVQAGFTEYAKRFPSSCQLKLIEIPLPKRAKPMDLAQCIEKESESLLATIKPQNQVIALEVLGEAWSTAQLAVKLKKWQMDGRDVDLLIGGPDGLSEACLKKATTHWSLSPLTLPHPIVRIVVAEQLYRGLMILQNHPYHRS